MQSLETYAEKHAHYRSPKKEVDQEKFPSKRQDSEKGKKIKLNKKKSPSLLLDLKLKQNISEMFSS